MITLCGRRHTSTNQSLVLQRRRPRHKLQTLSPPDGKYIASHRIVLAFFLAISPSHSSLPGLPPKINALLSIVSYLSVTCVRARFGGISGWLASTISVFAGAVGLVGRGGARIPPSDITLRPSFVPGESSASILRETTSTNDAEARNYEEVTYLAWARSHTDCYGLTRPLIATRRRGHAERVFFLLFILRDKR